jgi:Kef-type K+ transport system membrane component KefB
MRSRTKMQWILMVWTIVMATAVIIGNIIVERSNAPMMLGVLVGGNVLGFAAHIAGVVKENVSGNTSGPQPQPKGGN